MRTSNRITTADTLAAMAAALAWGAWTELGVSGWTATHGDWAIDLEPLIVFTALLGDHDPRLRDEATDWCIRNGRHISRVRLKNLLRAEPGTTSKPFGEFAATVSAHAGTPWPGATRPRPYTPSGRSTPPTLDRPSVAWLRLRATFGVGARSEILRVMLSRPTAPLSVAAIAAATDFTKRNVADECELLASAGVLAVRISGNRFYYSLARRTALETFLGDLPPIRPPWRALLTVTRQLASLEHRAQHGSPKTLGLDTNTALRLLAAELDELDLTPPPASTPLEDLWPSVQRLGTEWLGAWSVGRWPIGLTSDR